MDESLPTPAELQEDPELAVLRILRTTLSVAELALLSSYPESCEPARSGGSRSEQEAYVTAILHQIEALEGVLDQYVESIRRLRDWRDWQRRETSDSDIPF